MGLLVLKRIDTRVDARWKCIVLVSSGVRGAMVVVGTLSKTRALAWLNLHPGWRTRREYIVSSSLESFVYEAAPVVPAVCCLVGPTESLLTPDAVPEPR